VVHHNAVHPRLECAPEGKAFQLRDDFDPDLLVNVLGVFVAVEHFQADVERLGVVPINQSIESGLVALERHSDQISLRLGVVELFHGANW
jgi:hypothetical protein